ncbi:MAG: SpoIVB peptidase [Oscillospiraceae bacterium]|nr:SpoIVB peptidase [Oscillospiraceae bacterium]
MKNRTIRQSLAALAALIILVSATPHALAILPTELVPVGKTVGIDIKCEGVMVVALGEVETEDGVEAPGANAGLLPGDVITGVGSTKINSAAQLKAAVEEADGQTIAVQVLRPDGQRLQLNLTPARDKLGNHELGLWLRDGMAGIGTVTFYDPKTGIFGALGHAVSDVETGVLMPIGGGSIMPAGVKSVRRGTPGAPGELQGDFAVRTQIGALFANTPTGIFGHAMDKEALNRGQTLPVGSRGELKVGPATIFTNVSGTEVGEFAIEISRVFTGGDDRNMMITVTDPALIALTGGIVQGMSGSPIVQNGKIVGAVTHVLINNPEKGYGIAIDSMLENAFASFGALAA